MLDEVEANDCVDTARLYATGLSNGGMMSSLLACYDADRIAAVALVSGILHPGGCQPSRPVPMLVIWGKQDGILPYCGGVGPSIAALLAGKPIPDDVTPMCPPASFSGLPPVEDVVASWAKTEGCDATPASAAVSEHVEARTFSGCSGGAALQFYTVADGGHTWPGSKFMKAVSSTAAGAKLIGKTTDELNASETIWRFLQQYALAP